MAHQTARRSAAPTSLECPLASLGRTGGTVMDSLSGLHPTTYHHPLSSSPLDPQIYQMSRKSPDLSIDTDDVIYPSASIGQSRNDNIDGLASDHQTTATEEDNNNNQISLTDRGSNQFYQLAHTLNPNCLDQPNVLQQKAATFELRGRNHNYPSNLIQCDQNSASVGRIVHKQLRSIAQTAHQQRNFHALDQLMQCTRLERGPSAFVVHNNNVDMKDTNDVNSPVAGLSSKCLNHHSGGHCNNGVMGNPHNSVSYYLENKMDALYLGSAIRNLPLESGDNNFDNKCFYLEDGLRAAADFNTESRVLHHRTSSPSETTCSDRYLINRTNSPANAFTSANINNYCTSHNNNSSSSNLALDQHYHHNKIQSLSDGLCNLGRFSPSLDQGYATLVSPSPTNHHPNTVTTQGIVHHPPSANVSAAAAAIVSRHMVNGPPPWNKKGPYRAGPYFDSLPDEVVLKIFSWLNSCELCKVVRVCRRFEQLAWMPVLWKIISLKGEHLNGDKALKMIFRQLCGQTHNGSCPEVERVLLADGCKITDKGLQLLTRRCPELTHLQLQNCVKITNQALLDVLTKCTNVQHLDVTGCSQINTIAPHQNPDPHRRLLLQYLDLTDCLQINDASLKIIVKNCPQLVYLYLRRCLQISDTGLKFVPSFCIALKELSVSDCVNITDFGLYELAKLGAALRYLSVAKCDRVSDAGLKVIARRCYKLRYLNARGCEAVSDDSITVLARSCPRLRALDIGKCDVSDAGLRALAESCPNLKKLSLRNCDMITDRGVQCVAYYCRGLQQLNIQDCQISIEGYRAVKKYCKRCIIEHTNPGFC